MIHLQNIHKVYCAAQDSLPALNSINLSVSPGEIVGLIGKSGAGKSTLLRCVNLLERPTSGEVYVNHTNLMTLNVKQLRQIRHQIGMIFQHFNLLSSATVYHNVAFPLRLLKRSTNEIHSIVTALLEKVGLLHLAKSYPHQLSGGQKQRVAIARALATKPSVLLCDEMTSALDPETTADILSLIRQINQEYRLSILCVTHEMEVVKSIADRVAVIDEGKIIECNDVVNIFKNPQMPITKRFVQSVLKSDLPAEWQSKLQALPIDHGFGIMRLTFSGHATLEPIVNEWMRQTKVEVSILQAAIEKLRKTTIGQMIVSIKMNPMDLQKTTQFLEEKGLLVEVMGYVHANDFIA